MGNPDLTADTRLLAVGQYTSRFQADLAVARLADAGIPAMVFGGDSSYPSLPFAKGLEVRVNAQDYDRALAALQSAE